MKKTSRHFFFDADNAYLHIIKLYIISMKKYFFLALLVATAIITYAQNDTLPYLKNKEMPALIFLNLDSTEFNTFNIPQGKNSVLIYFSPTCEHCEMLTQEIIQNLDSFPHTVFYMISPVDMSVTRDFDAKYNVSQQKNMDIYKDAQHLFATYYGIKFLPFIVIYDKKKQLIKAVEGGIKMEELMELTEK